MSTSLLRRDSSKKNLQNLLKLTTQWSVEDEEEAARERRRRERQQQYLGSEGQSPEDGDGEGCTASDEHMGLKPSGPWETEEDEGFSDWSQKLEQRKLKAQAAEEREEFRQQEEEQSGVVGNAQEDAGDQQPKAEEEEDEGTSRYEAVEVNDEGDTCNYEHSSHETVTSNQWETRESNDNEEENRTPSPYPREEPQSFEQERGREEDRYEPYNDQRESHRWQSEEVKSQAVSSDGEDIEDITVKVTERAEVLNRSIQKSNSIKRSEPPLPINKIDDRLELYTHAIETSSKKDRLVRTPSLELLSPADAVANKKNLWESGEVTTASKSSPCKDTEGINIGVSEMINQWGKGKSEPDQQLTSPKVPEVKPGDVLSKKSLWEQNAKSAQSNKSMMPKYKFVPTGHGKYEKVRVEEP
ncbi:lymphocyte-specific protein 1 isoform X2 [Dendropsophus ebraccatus]|uniref:lymphocyte-specific protein 1 isoform X2 n=1 Tax=Dendropsophus ebraccatus TaxID=150705 RepID=UPI0038317CD7